MDNKRPKRRKDKYNPYTLHTEKEKYYISFTDANNCIQKRCNIRWIVSNSCDIVVLQKQNYRKGRKNGSY